MYQGSTDNIIGILQARDLLESIIRGGEIDLRRLLSDPSLYTRPRRFPPCCRILNATKSTLLWSPMITAAPWVLSPWEDLLEELVGDIWDEDEEEVQELVQVGRKPL